MIHPYHPASFGTVLALVFCVAAVVALLLTVFRRARQRWRWKNGFAAADVRRRVRNTPFPKKLKKTWLKHHPDRSAADFAAAAAGFQDYLVVVACTRGATALPSAAADSVWHLLLETPKAYAAYCRRAVGFAVTHVEKVHMTAPMESALALTWAVACRIDGIDPLRPRCLPVLFGLDAALRWPDGHAYRLDPDSGLPALDADPNVGRCWAIWLAGGLAATSTGWAWAKNSIAPGMHRAHGRKHRREVTGGDEGSSCSGFLAHLWASDAPADRSGISESPSSSWFSWFGAGDGGGSSCGASCGGSCGGGGGGGGD